MSDMLQMGAVATQAFKKGLDVTSHNIANLGTEGYHRQRAEFASNVTTGVGGSFQGGGSRVTNVERVYEQYIQTQLVSSSSMMSRYNEQLQLSTQVEGIVASNDEGMQQFIQRYYDSMQDLSNNPTSDTQRSLVLDEASNMGTHIGNLSAVLKTTHDQVNNQIKDLSLEINNRLETIKMVNDQVESALGSGVQAPNDLLDQREQAIFELGEYMDIKTFYQESGRIDIHTGNGRYPLISDNTLTRLEVDFSEYPDESRYEVFMTIGGQTQKISEQIQGGQLGGVIDFRNNMLDQSMNDMGLMLNGMVASTNWQHYQGYDVQNPTQPGGDFFTPLKMTADKSSKNLGVEDGTQIKVSFNPNSGVSEPPYSNNVSATTPPVNLNDQPQTYGEKLGYLDAALTTIGSFEAKEYRLQSDGATPANFSFFNHKTNENMTASAIETPAGSRKFQLDGLEFDLSTVQPSASGDKFIIKPHQEMLNSFEASLKDTTGLATRGQSPIDTGVLGDLSDEAPSADADGGNTNIANMASLQSAKLLFSSNGGTPTETLLGGYSKMTTNVGMYVRGTEIQLTAQTNVYQQINDRSQSMSGVSLDEEAANLMKYQQAYEAAAQIISTSQSIFQTLLGVVRG